MSSSYTAPTPATLEQLLQPQFDARPAIVLPASAGPRAGSFTYAELRKQIQSLQRSLLAGGLQTGQRVALSLTNGIELVAAFLAVTNSRAVAAPLNPAYTKEEVKVRTHNSKSYASYQRLSCSLTRIRRSCCLLLCSFI